MKFRYLWLLLILLSFLACEDKATEPDVSLTSPSNLSIEQLGFESIKLTWQDNSTNEIGFKIDRKIGEGDWEENYRILSEDINTFTDLNLITIANYRYRVSAISLDEESGFVEASIEFSYSDISYFSYPQFGPPLSVPCNGYTTFHLGLKDAEGNPVESEYAVWFKFLIIPEGCNINNELFNTTDSIAVRSEAGEVVVSLGAGQTSGVMSIKAYTYNSLGEEIFFIKSNILVLAGAPEVMDISIYETGIVENLGDGRWQIELAVNIKDSFGNPCQAGTTVYFSLPDNPEGVELPSPGAYIGNFSTAGDSIPGYGFTTLIYDGIHTNEEILLQVHVGDINNTESITLPLQGGYLDVVAVPFHLDWLWGETEDKSVTLRCLLRDAQNNHINNQQLEFSCELGQPVDMDSDSDDNPNTELTGYNALFDQFGFVFKDWVFQLDECPPPVEDQPGSITGNFLIEVTGTDIQLETTITIYRYPEE